MFLFILVLHKYTDVCYHCILSTFLNSVNKIAGILLWDMAVILFTELGKYGVYNG